MNTLLRVGAALFWVLLMVGEYLLCRSTKRRVLRLIPWIPSLAMLLLAAGTMLFGDGSGFLDLRGFIAVLWVAGALLCALAVAIGRLLAFWQERRR